MTVPSTTSRDSQTGNGVTLVFTVPFRILDQTHIQVLLTVGGVTTTQVLTTHYSVSGVGNPNTTVTFVTAPPSGSTITFLRSVPSTQETDYVPNDPFPAESHERALDKLTMLVQQALEVIARSLTLPAQVTGVSTQLPVPVASNIIGWDSLATALRNYTLAELATIISYADKRYQILAGDGVAVDFTLDADPGSLGNLEVSIDGVMQVPSIDFTYLLTTLTFAAAPANGAVILIRYDEALPTGVTNASAVNYTPAGITARTVEAKLLESVSVLDYIALTEHSGIAAGTNTNNQSVGFNAALAANKDVFVPAGTYYLTDVVTIPIGYRLRGAGRRKTIIKVPATFNLAALGVLRFAAGADAGEISNLTIEFTQPDSAVVGDYTQYPPAIYAVGTPRFKVRNVRISMAWNGIDMKGNSGGAVIEDLELSAFNIGIDIDGSLDTVKIDKLHLWPFGIGNATLTLNQRAVYEDAYGIKSAKCDDFKLSNSLIFSMIHALHFYNSGSGYTFGAITNCALDDRGGLWIDTDGRLTMAGGSMSMGRTDSWFINMTGGSLGVEAVRFQVSALQAVGNGLIELSGGTLSLGAGCLFEGAAHDKALVYSANAHVRATGTYFARNAGIAFASPMIRLINSTANLVGCFASAIGAGSGRFAQIDTDTGVVCSDNNLRGWTVQVPATSLLTNTRVNDNLGNGAEKDEFCGYFSADGATTVLLPNGWSVAKPGAGNYTVTHNLSLAAATDVVVVGIGGLANITVISDPGGGSANTFKLRSYLANTGAATDSDIHFIVRRRR